MSIIGAFIVPHPPIILPEIGKGEEKKIQKTIDSYRLVAKRIAELAPETIVVTTPHSILYADYFHISPGLKAEGNLRQFGVHNIILEANYDKEFVQKLEKNAQEELISAGTLGERNPGIDHGTLIPLKFINEFWTSYKLVRIGLSGERLTVHYQFGKCIAKTAEQLNRRTVFIASGDLSHRLKEDGPYGYRAEGPSFDQKVTHAMETGNFLDFFTLDPVLCENAGECGLRSFVIMAGALDGQAVRSTLHSYEGPFGVGYGVASFEITGKDENRHFDKIYEQNEKQRMAERKDHEDPYVRLARTSLETYLTTKKHIKPPENLPQEMITKRAGVFVSLKKFGQLRGCIGTIAPVTKNIAEEIIMNAISSGTNDPRFPPVTVSELPDLVYSVDVLSEAESIHSPDQLDVKRYGVIVSKDYRRGLLLPNLEGIDSVEQQISIAKQKAGIRKDETVTMERFEVVRHQ
ncbi:AmmeMemoRadiSam system protein A [Flexilinea flocculi]|jgi:AmmeMemoRadiSam system protein A|uniref:PH0010 family/AmmeMemoRadiSam system protein A n=1 Tax=Flexilinea flocculi TaxID=1678840 RepID=A0A0K8PAM9_9CHLR|nr:AmmeMemoRadiSam system protein A [Flexilinea flocculi]NMB94888.1 AmmeMemoRadiSam system protein A [Flexilinea flocculi]GAP39594.1 PH0010 family/AmmeMemoRadiSam system protein A [Flexilinea flocculi]